MLQTSTHQTSRLCRHDDGLDLRMARRSDGLHPTTSVFASDNQSKRREGEGEEVAFHVLVGGR